MASILLDSSTYSGGNQDVLNKDDTLRLDDEEVDKLVNIADQGVESILGQGVVFLGAELRGEAS